MARSRQQERIARNDNEKDFFYQYLAVIKKYFPMLMNEFKKADSSDPRNKSYIRYSVGFILIMLFFKSALCIRSLTGMVSAFEYTIPIQNLMLFGYSKYATIPCIKTINKLLFLVPTSLLLGIRKKIVVKLLRSKKFNNGRFNKQWVIIVDATQVFGGEVPINERCLKRLHNKGKDNEHYTYHINVLEAKIWLYGTNHVFSIDTEFIENDPKAGPNDKRSKEQIKQDCELAAFSRLAVRLRAEYPKLPIIIMGDALYVSQNVMAICKKYDWRFMIRYKEGTAPSIMDWVKVTIEAGDLLTIPDQTDYTNIGLCLSIEYYSHVINYIQATSRPVYNENGEIIEQANKFMWVTDLPVKHTVESLLKHISLGRGRWKIENYGFNRQKNWEHLLEHVCSWNSENIKKYYLLIQIADIFRTLFEIDRDEEIERKIFESNGEYKPLTRSFTEENEAFKTSFKSSRFAESVFWQTLRVLVEIKEENSAC